MTAKLIQTKKAVDLAEKIKPGKKRIVISTGASYPVDIELIQQSLDKAGKYYNTYDMIISMATSYYNTSYNIKRRIGSYEIKQAVKNNLVEMTGQKKHMLSITAPQTKKYDMR